MSEQENGKEVNEAEKPTEQKKTKMAKKPDKPTEQKKTKKAKKPNKPSKKVPSKLAKKNRDHIKMTAGLAAIALIATFALTYAGSCDTDNLRKDFDQVKSELANTQKRLESEIELRKAVERKTRASSRKTRLPPYTPAMQKLEKKWSTEFKSNSIEKLETDCAKPFGQHTARLARAWANLKKTDPADSYQFLTLLRICYFYKKMVKEPNVIGMKLLIRWAYNTYVAACRWHSYYNMPLIMSSFIRELEFDLGTYRDPHYRSVAPGPCPKTLVLRRKRPQTTTTAVYRGAIR